MSQEEVIERYDNILKNRKILYVIMTTFSILCTLLYWVFMLDLMNVIFEYKSGIVLSFVIFLIIVVIGVTLTAFLEDKIYTKPLEKWRLNIAIPYIVSLPPVTISDEFIANIELTEDNIWEVLLINDRKELEKYECSDVLMDLASSEKAFCEIRILTSSLNEEFQAGKYYPVVHLPVDYFKTSSEKTIELLREGNQ